MLRRIVILVASLSGAAVVQISSKHAPPFDASLALGDWHCHGTAGTYGGDLHMHIAGDGAMRMLLTLKGPAKEGGTIVAKARYRGTAGVREGVIFQNFASVDVIDATLDGAIMPVGDYPILESQMARQDAIYPIDTLTQTELVWLTEAGPIRCKPPE
jgi:hypothetical protein